MEFFIYFIIAIIYVVYSVVQAGNKAKKEADKKAAQPAIPLENPLKALLEAQRKINASGGEGLSKESIEVSVRNFDELHIEKMKNRGVKNYDEQIQNTDEFFSSAKAELKKSRQNLLNADNEYLYESNLFENVKKDLQYESGALRRADDEMHITSFDEIMASRVFNKKPRSKIIDNYLSFLKKDQNIRNAFLFNELFQKKY